MTVVVDEDLARLYGVTTGQLNQALKRNRRRFPRDFAFQLTVAECRAHLEAASYGDTTQDDLDDAQIAAFLAAAREHCEAFLGLSLAQRVLEIELDVFPNVTDDGTVEIELPFGPVVE